MTAIVKANETNAQLVSEIAKLSFLESHGNSASQKDLDFYMAEKYSEEVLREELSDPENIYHIIYENDNACGYSKIILNSPYEESNIQNITKLERIYLLKAFYGLNLGSVLLKFNIDLAKDNGQAGVWLYVWKENQRAINFYKKSGFIITGSHDFKVSATHSNPNHRMFLKF